jgi:hypothetical protein
MRISFQLLFFLSTINGFAQISLDQNDYFRFGNKYYRGYTTVGLDSINLNASTGPSQVWDFSWLASDINDSLEIIKADLTPYYSEFPTAEFAITTQANNFFYEELNPDGVRILGRVVYDGVEDFNTIYQFNTVGNSFRFPMEFETNYTFSYGYRVQYPAVFPGSDSIRNYNSSFFEIEADAWGTLLLPNGQFDVLRLKQTAYRTDTTQIYDAPGGWFSPTTSRDTIETWLFYTEDIGYRLLSFSQRINGSSKAVNWLRDYVLSAADINKPVQIKLHPQPADHTVYFTNSQAGTICIVDLQGKIMKRKQVSVGENQAVVSDLLPGMYFIFFENQSGKNFSPAKLLISR